MARMELLTTRYLGEEDKQSLVRRLARARGPIDGLRQMVENSECVDKLLLQISAAKAALTHVALELMEKHLVNCVETCMGTNREENIRRVTQALAAVLKNG